ncbi:MAG TPA: hypothetical protein DET40_16520 [Lentisphaeria bacterium]|nr:MAG: hypothetical protein A2X45_23055 [Lentisphaerae bacterium GWF2_50_93]HCE45147.1 hypothetical protein [Lentisphaeria bacterium]
MDGLLDEWMIGFEFKTTQKPWRYMRIIRKAIMKLPRLINNLLTSILSPPQAAGYYGRTPTPFGRAGDSL